MKRRAKALRDLKRGKPIQSERAKVLIVTEGEKTEPDYFHRLIADLELTTATVRISGEGGSAPISVYETAEKLLRHDNDYEFVFIAFDKDEHSTYDSAILKIAGLASKRSLRNSKVYAITSNPCFEVWFNLHVSVSCKPYSSVKGGLTAAKALIADLKSCQLDGQRIFAHYEKKSCEAYFSRLNQKRGDAVKRSRQLLENAALAGEKEYHENPSSRVHIIVETLEEIAKAM